MVDTLMGEGNFGRFPYIYIHIWMPCSLSRGRQAYQTAHTAARSIMSLLCQISQICLVQEPLNTRVFIFVRMQDLPFDDLLHDGAHRLAFLDAQ